MLENSMVVGEYETDSERGARQQQARDDRDAAADRLLDDPRTWERDEIRAAVDAKAHLMLDAAREQVAAPRPGATPHPRGFGYHFPADPVAELMDDYSPSRDAAMRLLLRAAASAGAERAALMAAAMDCAQTWAHQVIGKRARQMAEAAVEREGRA